MAEADFEALRARVTQLEERLTRQGNKRRRFGLASSLLAIFFSVAALGFIVTGLWLDAKTSPMTHQFVQLLGFQFLVSSLTLGLLAQALRSGRTI